MSPTSGLRRFVAYRLLISIPVLLIVSVLVFWIFENLADPALLELGPMAAPEALARRRHELGLDRPLLGRFGNYLGRLARLRFGVSSHRHLPVSTLVGDALPATLSYALPGLALGTALALTGGMAAAERRGQRIDALLVVLSTFLVSLSSLVIVIVAHQFIAGRMHWSPVSWPLTGKPPTVSHLLLPVSLWAAIQVGPDLRHFRALWIAELESPHHEAMLARGIPLGRRRIHGLRGIAGGVVTRVGHRLPFLAVGSVVLEETFNIPGVGRLVVDALRHNDLPLMEGVTLLLTAATLLAQVAADLGAGWLDPRLRRW